MGRNTFEPALASPRSPWPDLDVFVLGSNVASEGAKAPILADSDPVLLLEKMRADNRGGDVHLVGGPRTIATFRALGALDKLGLLVIPILLGDGMPLTPTERALPGGSVEIVYACRLTTNPRRTTHALHAAALRQPRHPRSLLRTRQRAADRKR
jgi:dihydrofolate reductase